MKYYAIKEDGVIRKWVKSSFRPEGYIQVTSHEIQEFEESLKPTFVTISIPLAVFRASADLQAKLSEMALIFSDIKRRPDANGNLVLSNINLIDVPAFLTSEEYTQLSAVGVVFDDKIDALFVTEE